MSYREYFDIDPEYFPQVDKKIIEEQPDLWKKFYPHPTFIKLLKSMVDVLSRKQKLSVWVDGAYGTGKSHAVLTLKKLIEASDEETNAYFERYNLDNFLCQKLIAQKNEGKILVCHRYGSSDIQSDTDLVVAIQEGVEKALADAGIENVASTSLKNSLIRYFEDEENKQSFDIYARTLIAECIGAQPDEIYFTSGGTESDNWAIKGIAEKGKKHHTIATQIEHHAILNACRRLEHFGFQVDYLPVDKQGVVSCEELVKFIKGNTELISVMMVNNEIGTIEPIKELATVAHDNGILFHTDAVQAVGHIPIDVSDLCVDMLSASAHKFNGPKGIGFLYIKRGTKISSFADGGAQEFHKRAGTENIASIVGMSIALKKSCDEMEKVNKKLLALDEAFNDVLLKSKIDFIRNGSENHVPGNINLSIRKSSGEMLLHRLDLMGMCISTGSACDSVNTEVSHVIKAIGVPSEYSEGTIRISFGRDNTEEDAVTIARALVKVLNE